MHDLVTGGAPDCGSLLIPQGRRVWLDHLGAELEKGQPADDLIVCAPDIEAGIGEVDRGKRQVFHWISSAQPDRVRDVIVQEGIDFTKFNSNPVWLLAHAYYGLPIGVSTDHGIKDGRAYSIVAFWGADDLPHGRLCETVFRLTADRIMRGCSIGARLLKHARNEKRRGLDIEECELLEVSKVSVPAQPLALAKDAAAAGIDLAPLLEWSYRLIEETKAAVLLPLAQADILAKYLGYGSGLELVQVDAEKLATLRGEDTIERGVSPRNVSDAVADKAWPWSRPALKDFTTEGWEKLSVTEKRRIAGHFAYTDEMPPKTYGSLHLPHHDPKDGKIVPRGLYAAAARLNQLGDEAGRAVAKRHLTHDYGLLGEKPPWEKSAEDWADFERLAAGLPDEALPVALKRCGFVEEAKLFDADVTVSPAAPALTEEAVRRIVAEVAPRAPSVEEIKAALLPELRKAEEPLEPAVLDLFALVKPQEVKALVAQGLKHEVDRRRMQTTGRLPD